LLFSGGMVQGTRRYGTAGGQTFKILGIYDVQARVYRWTETIEGRLLQPQSAAGSTALQHIDKFISAITDDGEFVLEAVMVYTEKRMGQDGVEQPARFVGEVHTSTGQAGNLELIKDTQLPWGGIPRAKRTVTGQEASRAPVPDVPMSTGLQQC